MRLPAEPALLYKCNARPDTSQSLALWCQERDAADTLPAKFGLLLCLAAGRYGNRYGCRVRRQDNDITGVVERNTSW